MCSKTIRDKTIKFPKYDSLKVGFYNDYFYDGIFSTATEEELFMLTNHPKPMVRRSAFYSLLMIESSKVLYLLKKNLNDTTQWFSTQTGCIRKPTTLLDEILLYLSPETGWGKYYKLSEAQIDYIKTLRLRREYSMVNHFENGNKKIDFE